MHISVSKDLRETASLYLFVALQKRPILPMLGPPIRLGRIFQVSLKLVHIFSELRQVDAALMLESLLQQKAPGGSTVVIRHVPDLIKFEAWEKVLHRIDHTFHAANVIAAGGKS